MWIPKGVTLNREQCLLEAQHLLEEIQYAYIKLKFTLLQEI